MPTLDDLFTPEQAQQLYELWKGVVTYNPESELLRVFAPADVNRLIEAGYKIRRESKGRGKIVIGMDGGVVKFIEVTQSVG